MKLAIAFIIAMMLMLIALNGDLKTTIYNLQVVKVRLLDKADVAAKGSNR